MDETLVERLGHLLSTHANAKQLFADPVERDGVTVIPVAKVQWGLGGGGLGSGSIERGGAGGGVRAMPTGFIEIRDGRAEFRPIRDASDVLVIAGTAFAALAIGFLLSSRRA